MLPQPNDGFAWAQVEGGHALVCDALAVPHLFTTREWALGSRVERVEEDWWPVAASLGVDRAQLVRVHQVHGAGVVVRRAGERSPQPLLPDADILVSDDPSIALAMQTADCVPLLIADRVTGAVAAAHAGWRGLALRVPEVTVATLARVFGSRPENLVAAVGPSICADRYEVGADVREQFSAAGFSPTQLAHWFPPGARPGHSQFDGWRSAQDQLVAAGLAPVNIHIAAMCTATFPDLFCSYRRDGKAAGRMAAGIRKLKPKS